MHFYNQQNLYTNNKNISEYTVLDSYLSNTSLIYCEIEEISQKDQFPKVLFTAKPNQLDEIIRKIPKSHFDKFTIVKSEAFFLEFVSKETSKGIAIKYLTEYLGLTAQNVITIGDNENDISMLKYAKCGIAMGNATNEVKKSANYITLSNNDDGVSHALKEFIPKLLWCIVQYF